VVNYRSSADAALRLVAEISDLGVGALAVQADVTRSADVANLNAEARASFGRVDILVNNASIYPVTPLGDLTEAQWDAQLAIDLKAPYLCCLEFGRRMAAEEGGAIVNFSDWAALRPYRNYLPYLTAKGGIITMTKAFAVELAPKVRVNAIAPGPIQPPSYLSEDEKQESATGTLLKRWGGPGEIARAIAFLAEADYITGTVLRVDGGRLIADG
jgi:pteridine reductase